MTDPVERLARWQEFGAKWRVLSDDESGLTISLCRCDSDEEVDRVISADPALRDFVAGRPASE